MDETPLLIKICGICMGDIKDDIACPAPSHIEYKESKKEPVEDIQVSKFGAYVDAKTGKIVKAKALNNPVTLGIE